MYNWSEKVASKTLHYGKSKQNVLKCFGAAQKVPLKVQLIS